MYNSFASNIANIILALVAGLVTYFFTVQVMGLSVIYSVAVALIIWTFGRVK